MLKSKKTNTSSKKNQDKTLNGHFIQEDLQMTNNMQRCSTSHMTEMQISKNNKMQPQTTMATICNRDKISVGQHMDR